MDITSVKTYFKGLENCTQKTLLEELTMISDRSEFNLLSIREEQLNNKQGSCPHCNSIKYTKDGRENSGVQRYRCKSCRRSFNSFSGTWLAKINKKELLVPYLKLMREGLSLEKTKNKLKINKKTAFDWRHKIAASLSSDGESKFEGITESDETFFLHSRKGSKNLLQKPRKRGKKAKARGINKEHVATIVTMDRAENVDLKVACLGRITKKDIVRAIGEKISAQTVLCTDGHVSYKGFAIDNNLEHHVLRADLKQHVKQKTYHIQHVNSADSRLKTWIDREMHGVATKYLQSYLNWFRFKEKYKGVEIITKMINSALDSTGRMKFRNIEAEYEILLKPQSI